MSRLRSIVGGSAGNLVEWFDWYVYSAFSLYFAKAFFPAGDATAQFLGTSMIFWIGFLMRPLGGWIVGRVADTRGRRAALAWSVAAMCGGSLLIAVTPGYAAIGVAAPALLIVARIVQGLSLGGEYGTSAAYLTEIASPAHRGFWSSFQYVTLVGGQLLALGLLVLLQQVMGETALAGWGWRIPFVVGAALALVVFWIRRGIAETQGADAREKAQGGLKILWAGHRRALLIAFGMAIGSNVAFYTYTTYMQKYLVVSAGFGKATASVICTLALIAYVAMQPAAAALSDRIGRKPLLYWFGIGGVLLTVPLMTAIGAARDPLVAFLLVTAALVIVTGGHLNERGHQGRALPRARPRAGHRAALCAQPVAVRRIGGGGGARAQAMGARELVFLVRDRAHRGEPRDLRGDARDALAFGAGRGWGGQCEARMRGALSTRHRHASARWHLVRQAPHSA